MVASTFHVGIDLSNKITKVLCVPGGCGAYGVRCAQGPIKMISTGFSESHFEFRVNQELYRLCSVIIGFIIQKNMGLETKILSLSIPDAE